MIIATRFLIVIALASPAILGAQGGMRGGRGGGGRGRGEGGGRGAGRNGGAAESRPLSNQDILKNSPLRLLIDRKEDLGLTGAQQGDLVNRQFALDQRLTPLLDQLDSARTTSQPPADPRALSDDERQAMIEHMRAMHTTMTAIRAAEDSAASAAVAMLTATQQPKANQLLAKRRDELQKNERAQRPDRSQRSESPESRPLG